MNHERPGFDSNIILRVLLCVFLGACLYLYIVNNHLLADGAQNLRNIEALIMFFVLAIPFVLALVHLVRSLRRPSDLQA